METRFSKLVLSLSVLFVALPGHLGAWTPANNSTEPFTAGISQSTSPDEFDDVGRNASSTSYNSESLSPSQRNTLLSLSAEPHTAAAGSLGKRSRGASATLGSPPLSLRGESVLSAKDAPAFVFFIVLCCGLLCEMDMFILPIDVCSSAV